MGRTYRTGPWRFLTAYSTIIGVMVATVAVIDGRGIGRAVGVVVGGGMAAYALLRLRRLGLEPRDREVVIRNLVSTIRVPWDEIRKFELRHYGLFSNVAHADLKDGRTLHILTIQPPNPLFRPNNRDAQRMIEELNDLVTSHTETTPPPTAAE